MIPLSDLSRFKRGQIVKHDQLGNVIYYGSHSPRKATVVTYLGRMMIVCEALLSPIKEKTMDKVTNIYGDEFKVGDETISTNYGICTIASISSCSLIYITLPCTSVRATALSDLRRRDSDKLPPKTEPEWFDYSYNAEIIAAIKEGREVWCKSPSDEWKLLQNAATCSLHTTYNFQWTLTKPTRKVIKNVEIWSNKYKDGFRAFYSSEDEAIKNIIPGCIATVKLTGQYEVEE